MTMNNINERIHTLDELRHIIPLPKPVIKNKSINYIDDTAERFIKNSPFVLIASRASNGHLDVSPKGDPAGFVKILDKHTLAIPERRGNNRIDTFKNILNDPHVSLLFFIPEIDMTLRLSGTAIIARDDWLLDSMMIKGIKPKLVTVVSVNQVMSHCGKSLVRSGLWKNEEWKHENVPSMAEMIIAHSETKDDALTLQRYLDQSLIDRLY